MQLQLILAAGCMAMTTAAFGAEVETFVLKDGRKLIGTYDQATEKLTVNDGKHLATITLHESEIKRRTPYVSPEEIAAKNAAAAEAKAAKDDADSRRARDASQRLKDEEQKLADADAEKRAKVEAVETERLAKAQAFEADKAAAEKRIQSNKDRAAFWKARGYDFDPSAISAAEMDDHVQAEIDAKEAASDKRRQDANDKEVAERKAGEKSRKDLHDAELAILQEEILKPAGTRESSSGFPKNIRGEWWLEGSDGKLVDAYTVADEGSRVDVQSGRTQRFEHLYQDKDADGKVGSFEAFPYADDWSHVMKYVYFVEESGKVIEAVVVRGNKVVDFHTYRVK